MRANPKYPGQLRRMREDVEAGRAVIVYLRRYARGRQRYNPTEQEVRGDLGFVPLAQGNDGAIYQRRIDGGSIGGIGGAARASAPTSAPSPGALTPPTSAPDPGASTPPPDAPSLGEATPPAATD
jgi:hypothetical protein